MVGSFLVLFFSLLAFGLFISHIIIYNPLQLEKTEGIVHTTFSQKGLATPPKYYAVVTLPDNPEQTAHRITQKQINALDRGDEMAGLKIANSSFSSYYDVIRKTIWLAGLLIVCGAMIFIGAVMIYLQLPLKQTNRDKTNTILKRVFKKRFIIIPLSMVGLLLLSQLLTNMFHELFTFDHIETEAEVQDRDYTAHRGGKMTTISYSLQISFHDQHDKPIHVLLDVPKKTYDIYHEKHNIPIAYRSGNPYDVFLQGDDKFTVKNIGYFSPNMLYVYMLVLFIAVPTVWGAIKQIYRRRK